MNKNFFFLTTINISVVLCQSITFTGKPEIFFPGIISQERSEVKITFGQQGNLVLWGAIGREKGVGGFDIWQSERTEDGWSEPRPASFNSVDNDFDPCFSADSKTLYFFSNRPGGFGGDDLYSIQYDSATHSFGTAVNMGSAFNTTGDEWGPSESRDGKKFLYCTNGKKGKGEHDVFVSERTSKGWGSPKNIEGINSTEDDFDPVFLHDCTTIIFTRKKSEDEAYLYVSFLQKKGYTIPILVDTTMNIAGTWNFGSSIDPNDSSSIYYSTHIQDNSKGRLDIYKIPYAVSGYTK